MSLRKHRGIRTQRNRLKGFKPVIEQLEAREVPTATPYLVPTAAGVEFTSILTTGDSVGSYRMAGTPDGLGAFDNGDGTFTVLMNHEFNTAEGVAHTHNASLGAAGKGSYVDRLVIRKSDLAVLSAGDQIQTVLDGSTFSALSGSALNINRLCSADLPALSAFYNAATGLGTTERIFMNGEETGGGRAFAHIVTGPNNGTSYTLPAFNTFGGGSWENLLANPASGDTTLVMANSDNGTGSHFNRVMAYVGTKQATGNEIERAGLTNGTLYQVKDNGDGTFSLVNNDTGTVFSRPEDGAWDPNHPNDFYFVTTASFGGNTQLRRMHFNDLANPLAGGTIEVLINGQAIAKMFDNVAIDGAGRVVLQEDVGNNAWLGKVWMYDISSGALVEVGHHDPDRFITGAPNFLTQDEESSGVIDMSAILGEGTYLLDVQAHYANADPALVEGGQLLLMRTGAIAGLGYDAAHSNAPALVVLGTSANEHIEVTQIGNTFNVRVGDTDLAELTGVVNQLFAVGYDGNDHIDLSGVQANASIYGGDGNDHLYGGDGDDYLNGGAGNDLLDGGAGANRLEGGLGNDDFVYSALDTLLDFGIGNDHKKN
jgi:Ca2+-binding RTX toxin-like protein